MSLPPVLTRLFSRDGAELPSDAAEAVTTSTTRVWVSPFFFFLQHVRTRKSRRFSLNFMMTQYITYMSSRISASYQWISLHVVMPKKSASMSSEMQ